MLGTLYRYHHPEDSTRFIYVGQGSDRDRRHRSGSGSFGRRFKRDFPNFELPQPIREVVEVADRFELNELETIWMFRYHTWRGYDGGMNLTFPGRIDYTSVAILGSAAGSSKGGLVAGRKAAENGQLKKALAAIMPEDKIKYARMGGQVAKQSGQIRALGLANIGKAQASRSTELKQELGHRNIKFALAAAHDPNAMKQRGIRAMCLMWKIRKGKSCTCGTHVTSISKTETT